MKPIVSTKPHLIIMVGIPGSGKSFFAEHFATTFNAPIVSFDKLRQALFIPMALSDEEDIIINRVANYMLDEVLKTGRTVLYEGLTNLRNDRNLIAKKARDADYEPMFVWVQTELIDAKKRATKANGDKPALDDDRFKEKLKQFNSPHPSENPIVISGKHTYASQLKIVLKHLVEPRAQMSGNVDNSR